MQNTLFVSALFNHTKQIGLHGRTGRKSHYLESLLNITKIGSNIILYCSDKDVSDITDIQYPNNLFIRQYNLLDYKYHEYFSQQLLINPPLYKDRCFHIMHNKIDWLYENIQSEYEYLYWIDCGLSYEVLFPKKYRTTQYDCVLFNKQLVNGLNKCNNQIMIMTGDNLSPLPNKMLLNQQIDPYKKHNRVIGGIFGGKKENIEWLYDKYQELFHKMLSANLLLREEEILTAIYWNYPDKFIPHRFTTWYHEDSPNRNITSKDICFYHIFEKLNGLK